MRPIKPAAAAALALLGGLAACVGVPGGPPPGEPSARTVAALPEQVRERVATAFRDLGLSPRTVDAGITAEARGGTPEAWATCKRALVRYTQDPQPRSAWVSPDARTADAHVAVSPAGDGQTRVSVDTEFAATYRDPFRNQATTRDCASTGVLETRLLDAAAAAQGGRAGS